jgi:hypothetical protein
MSPGSTIRRHGFAMAAIVSLYACLSVWGIRWGLPNRQSDPAIFGGAPWEGSQIAELAGHGARADTSRAADVDVNPLGDSTDPRLINQTVAQRAEIYARYRLYSQQPDEMITLMALSGMNPRTLSFDPKLYQYGGLFIYPVGVLLATCDALGWVTVRSDLAYYFDRPEEFGKFYVVARAYVAAWGVVGVMLVFAIGRRLAGSAAGLWSATLFVLLPVVTAMSHEAKPHLPGAVLMLAAVWATLRALDLQRRRDWVALYVLCGAAAGMVLSAAPIVLLIPLTLGIRAYRLRDRDRRSRGECARAIPGYGFMALRAACGGCAIAVIAYFATNPFVFINLFNNREVLRSNFGNSLNMYAVGRIGEGLLRVADLTLAGATWPVVACGLVALAFAVRRRLANDWLLIAPAAVLALQFVLLGAGKPDEYGRFGVFYEAALAIGCGAVVAKLAERMRVPGALLAALTVLMCLWQSGGYFWSFRADATGAGSRDQAAARLAQAPDGTAAVVTEPAPYSCPPLDFGRRQVILYRRGPQSSATDGIHDWLDDVESSADVLLAVVDDPATVTGLAASSPGVVVEVFENRSRWLPRARLSWANKPVVMMRRSPRGN